MVNGLTAVFDRSRLDPQLINNRLMAEKRRRRERELNRDAKERREALENQAENNVSGFAGAVAVSPPASAARIEAFGGDLDIYDAVVVEALMENDVAMQVVQAQIDALLARAHVMEDGRRVFKTEDGMQVFDEHGNDVTHEIDPIEISDDRPVWEEMQAELKHEVDLKSERAALLDYQQKLDDARASVADGEITEAELDEIEAKLIEDMPEAVRAKLPGNHPAVEQTAEATETLNPDQSSPSLNGLTGYTAPGMGG